MENNFQDKGMPKIKVVTVERGNRGKTSEILLGKDHDFFKFSTKCTVPDLLGVPIYVLRDYNNNYIKNEKQGLKGFNNALITKLMIKVEDGFAAYEWSENIGDAIVGRRDGLDFTLNEFYDLEEYIEHILDLWGNGFPPNKKVYTREYYLNYLEKIKIPTESFDEDVYDEKAFRKSYCEFVETHKFWNMDTIKKFNIENSRPMRNANYNLKLHEKCEKIYYLIGKENNDEIKSIMKEIYNEYGMDTVRNCYYIIYDSSPLRDDMELYSYASNTLNNNLEGIGGWQV